MKRGAPGTMKRGALVLLLGTCLLGCGTSPPGPGQVVESYLNQIAGGSYAGACAALTAQARQTLVRSAGSRVSCGTVFARCLPNEAAQLKRDQTQLFYVNVAVSVAGSKSSVHVSGTAVANQVREVTLARQRGIWRLTSPGKKLEACVLRQRRHRAR